MSSLLTTKTLGIVGGIAGVSDVGGGIAYGTGLFNDSKTAQQAIVLTNNRTKLTDEGFEVLNTDATNSEWQKVLDAYLLATKGTFKNGGVADTTKTKEELIQECQRQLNLNTVASYKLTRQWCVKQETIRDILKKKSKVLITNETTTDDNEWKTKINNLTEEDKTSLSVKKGDQEKENITSIKAGCKTASEKKTTDAEFNEKFEVAKRVCTVPKP